MCKRYVPTNVAGQLKDWLTKASLRDRLSPKTRERLRRLRLNTWYRLVWPRPLWGGMRRAAPFHTDWGRGSPVDRVYIERFIARHADDIRGEVLEVGRPQYTTQFGRAGTTPNVLDIAASNTEATFVADLGKAHSLPAERFDCFILTQTLQLVRRPRVAIENCFNTLRPGGVLLVTVPCACRVAPEALASELYDDLWRFTPWGLAAILHDVFSPREVQVEGHGNVLATIAFLMGLGSEELRRSEYEVNDPGYPLVACARARKAQSSPAPATCI